jgi:hypothetical protein
MTTNRLSHALIALALAGGLSACGAADAQPDASPTTLGGGRPDTSVGADAPEPDAPVTVDGPIDVCALLTIDQIETAFESTFDPGELTHHEQTGGDQCVWSNNDGPPVKVFSVAINTDAATRAAFGISIVELFDQTKEYATDPRPVDLGDQAYVSGSGLYVLVGDVAYDFSIVTGTSDMAHAGMQSLAAEVIAAPLGS